MWRSNVYNFSEITWSIPPEYFLGFKTFFEDASFVNWFKSYYLETTLANINFFHQWLFLISQDFRAVIYQDFTIENGTLFIAVYCHIFCTEIVRELLSDLVNNLPDDTADPCTALDITEERRKSATDPIQVFQHLNNQCNECKFVNLEFCCVSVCWICYTFQKKKKKMRWQCNHLVDSLVLSVSDFGWLCLWVSKPGWILYHLHSILTCM